VANPLGRVRTIAPSSAIYSDYFVCLDDSRHVRDEILRSPSSPPQSCSYPIWATLRVQIVVLGLIYLASAFGISVRSLSSLLGLLASCAVGWLVTRDLSRKYGTPTKFPAVGAKVVITMIIITLLIVVAIIVITGA